MAGPVKELHAMDMDPSKPILPMCFFMLLMDRKDCDMENRWLVVWIPFGNPSPLDACELPLALLLRSGVVSLGVVMVGLLIVIPVISGFKRTEVPFFVLHARSRNLL
jgi:hypothetical protein